MSRLAPHAWQLGDLLPAVGSICLISGANCDITCDQDRSYGERFVIGYSNCDQFICLQTEGCWPTVERLTNCWFGQIQTLRPDPDVIEAREVVCRGHHDLHPESPWHVEQADQVRAGRHDRHLEMTAAINGIKRGRELEKAAAA